MAAPTTKPSILDCHPYLCKGSDTASSGRLCATGCDQVPAAGSSAASQPLRTGLHSLDIVATNVYIDGFNFYFGAVKGTVFKWVDFEALSRLLVPNDEIGRIKYFTAKVSERYPGDKAPHHQSLLLRAIRSNPKIDVVLGHFRSASKWRPLDDHNRSISDLLRPELQPHADADDMWTDSIQRRTVPFSAARVVHREEKGSDVNLAVQLLWDCFRDDECDKALVITNDSDLEDAIRKAVESGCSVGLVNPQPQATNRRLKDVASFEIPFRAKSVEKCQMPKTVFTEKGAQVHRPRAWGT